VNETKESIDYRSAATTANLFYLRDYGFALAFCPDFNDDLRYFSTMAFDIVTNLNITANTSFEVVKCNSTIFPMQNYNDAQLYNIAS
jgi:hypothetical protein